MDEKMFQARRRKMQKEYAKELENQTLGGEQE